MEARASVEMELEDFANWKEKELLRKEQAKKHSQMYDNFAFCC